MALINDTVRLKVNFKTFDGTAVDPTNITLKIYDDKKQLIETISIDDTNKLNVGVYFYDYIIPSGEEDLYIEFQGLLNNKPIVTRKILRRSWS
ncbi:hypothetical protein [Desulfotomaculum nigrificans]|uniref:hypothetical protein n=1 Tax=Desulfotomaculum nigrificans TaxID=1565 RepID=UPI0001FAECE7|nr:hypothetical protein [Desulfotomaculum nigrificans]